MTDNQYLESVIKTQCLSAEELKELEQHRLEIESLLREDWLKANNQIRRL